MRIYTLKCVSFSGMRQDPDNGEVVEEITIETRECTTVSDMVDNFNTMLASMGFIARVDVADTEE